MKGLCALRRNSTLKYPLLLLFGSITGTNMYVCLVERKSVCLLVTLLSLSLLKISHLLDGFNLMK